MQNQRIMESVRPSPVFILWRAGHSASTDHLRRPRVDIDPNKVAGHSHLVEANASDLFPDAGMGASA